MHPDLRSLLDLAMAALRCIPAFPEAEAIRRSISKRGRVERTLNDYSLAA
jgi:hypothetical protein